MFDYETGQYTMQNGLLAEVQHLAGGNSNEVENIQLVTENELKAKNVLSREL